MSLAPSSEMAGGLGTPPIQSLIDRDIRPGLGIDEERLTPGDLFAQMRATISMQHATVFDRKLAGKAGVPKLMSTRDVIRHATVDGARAAGLGAVTGSLEPGKQADIVMLRTDRPNIFPINDPIGAVVWGMDTSNVDWVFVAGRALMRGGALEADVEHARNLATTAQQRVAAAAGSPSAPRRGVSGETDDEGPLGGAHVLRRRLSVHAGVHRTAPPRHRGVHLGPGDPERCRACAPSLPTGRCWGSPPSARCW